MIHKGFSKPLIKNEFFVSIICLLFLSCYYLFFINKGLVLGDEGYSAHIAERILHGEIPYRDFFLQYPPGYFYLLAGLYKIFGASIIVGRALSLIICLGIFIAALFLLREFGITSQKSKIITLLSIAAFGYPLINIPIVVWPTVLITILIMLSLLGWLGGNNKSYLLSIGIFLALLFFIKQNIAIAEIIAVNLILFFAAIKKGFKITTYSLFLLNAVWIVPTFAWVYLFFLRNNISALTEFMAFNQRYIGIYPFSYPPLSYLLQPLGLLKLLPYYSPILFFILLVATRFQKNADKKLLIFFLPLAGFFTTVFPTSDLLHVYPYFGLTLVSLFIFMKLKLPRVEKISYTIIFLCIVSGFYLTLFREYYRYQAPYRVQNTSLNLPRTKGMLIDMGSVQNINATNTFITNHTQKNDYIFVYSFSPMLYFLLERQNPSRYSIYYPGYLTAQEEKKTLEDIKKEKVKYIVDDGFDYIPTPLSTWIKKQKKIQQYGQFTIFYVQE